MNLVLLPGMDGTGNLFAEFVKALPDEIETVVVRYPVDVCLSYSELLETVRSATPDREPFVIVAESFSTPLAILFAATTPKNLKGMVLCAGFAASPMRGWQRSFSLLLSPVLLRLPLPKPLIEFLLVGQGAHPSLVSSVQAAVRTVRPKVLLDRFRSILKCDVREELSKIAAPILYMRATRDRLVQAFCLEEIRRVNPRISVAEIPGPHLILQREPSRTAEVVLEFVQRID
jgi:pimeloyl-ACP methyl ester carboxylesterase